MGSHSVPPFFRLPAELRLEIYKFAWTASWVEHLYVCQPTRHDISSREFRLSLDHITAQLLAIRKLGATSQRIRTEAYLECFDRTQIILRYADGYATGPLTATCSDGVDWYTLRRNALHMLAGSYLLQTQARHVYLHCPVREEENLKLNLTPAPSSPSYNASIIAMSRGRDQLNEKWAVECISRFKNLRSLEVHVDEGAVDDVMASNYWRWYIYQLDPPNNINNLNNLDNDGRLPAYDYEEALKRMIYDDERRKKLLDSGIYKMHHGKLDKVMLRTNIADPDIIKLMKSGHKAFKWWRQLKEDLAVLVSAPDASSSGMKGQKTEDTYVVFKQFIGSCHPPLD